MIENDACGRRVRSGTQPQQSICVDVCDATKSQAICQTRSTTITHKQPIIVDPVISYWPEVRSSVRNV